MHLDIADRRRIIIQHNNIFTVTSGKTVPEIGGNKTLQPALIINTVFDRLQHLFGTGQITVAHGISAAIDHRLIGVDGKTIQTIAGIACTGTIKRCVGRSGGVDNQIPAEIIEYNPVGIAIIKTKAPGGTFGIVDCYCQIEIVYFGGTGQFDPIQQIHPLTGYAVSKCHLAAVGCQSLFKGPDHGSGPVKIGIVDGKSCFAAQGQIVDKRVILLIDHFLAAVPGRCRAFAPAEVDVKFIIHTVITIDHQCMSGVAGAHQAAGLQVFDQHLPGSIGQKILPVGILSAPVITLIPV